MGVDWNDPLVKLKATSIAFSTVAIIITCFRLYLRRARLWWDDAAAFGSMIFLFLQIASVFMHVSNPDELPKPSRVAAYYIIAATFYAIIWTARLSILFSIMRIETSPRALTQLRAVAYIFTGCLMFLMAQLFWVCQPEPKWMDEASPQCQLGVEVGVCQVVTDVLSDLLLCVAPLRVIQHIRDRALRRRLKIIFSTSIITTIVSLVHVGYLFTVGGSNLIISAIAEDCVSLIVANIPVVLAGFLRQVGVNEAEEDNGDGLGGSGQKWYGRGRGRGRGRKTEPIRTGTGFGFRLRTNLMSTTGWGTATGAAGDTTTGILPPDQAQMIELPLSTLTTVSETLSDSERSKMESPEDSSLGGLVDMKVITVSRTVVEEEKERDDAG